MDIYKLKSFIKCVAFESSTEMTRHRFRRRRARVAFYRCIRPRNSCGPAFATLSTGREKKLNIHSWRVRIITLSSRNPKPGGSISSLDRNRPHPAPRVIYVYNDTDIGRDTETPLNVRGGARHSHHCCARVSRVR